MSNHETPEQVASPERRCEALVKGRRGCFYKWMEVDRQCPKPHQQMRGQLAVCYIHARTKTVTPWAKAEQIVNEDS